MEVTLVDDIGLYHQVVVEELRSKCVVGVYTTHFGGREEHVIGFFLAEEMGYCCLIAQVEFAAASENELVVPPFFEGTHQCGADHSVVTGYVDA